MADCDEFDDEWEASRDERQYDAMEAQAYWQEQAEKQAEEEAKEDRLFQEAREREYAAKLAVDPYHGIMWRQMNAKKAHELLVKQETDPARRAAMQATFEKEQADELQAAREFNQKKREEALRQKKKRQDAEEARKKEAEAERSDPQALYAVMRARESAKRGENGEEEKEVIPWSLRHG